LSGNQNVLSWLLKRLPTSLDDFGRRLIDNFLYEKQ